jgi:hypothetical protein
MSDKEFPHLTEHIIEVTGVAKIVRWFRTAIEDNTQRRVKGRQMMKEIRNTLRSRT